MALEVTGGGSGAQSGQQSDPQSSVGTSGIPALAGSVQPGTPTNDLTSSNGISLAQTPLTTVNLSTGSGSTSAAMSKPAAHQVNPLLIVLVVLLFAAAAVIFAAVSQSGKKHNQY